jgi:predicted transcriptional regulator
MAMTLRLTEEQTRALRETADREHRSMQEVALTAVDEYVSRRVKRRDEALARIAGEDDKLFQRLAEA